MSASSREHAAVVAAYRSFSDTTELRDAVVLAVPEAPQSPMLNRIVGVGVERAATPDDVDEALSAVVAGTVYYVALAPGVQPPELPTWLAQRGLEPGWGWMSFRRPTTPLRAPDTDLAVQHAADDRRLAGFARVIREAYELPEAVEPRLGTLADCGWECLVALDGEAVVGAAALFAQDGVAYLGMAATLASARGRGAQSALLAARIDRAAQLGCDAVLTETGERRDDRPSNSYRNILRAGFQEVGVTSNWLGRA